MSQKQNIFAVLATDISRVSPTYLCPVATENICLASTTDISSVARADFCLDSTHNFGQSEVSTVPMLTSQTSQWSTVAVSNVFIVPKPLRSQKSHLSKYQSVEASGMTSGSKFSKRVGNESKMVASA